MGALERPALEKQCRHRIRRGTHATQCPPTCRIDSDRPSASAPHRPQGSLDEALQSIKPDAILEHIKVLASDEFEGRGPGTPGEEKTVAYLTGQFREMGLKPGNPDGTYVQNVPLVGFQATRVSRIVPSRRQDDRARVSQGLRRRVGPGRRTVEGRGLGRRLRRLRRGRARVRLGRLQGARRPRQDADHAGQRPARPRSQGLRPSSTRPSSRAGR